MSDELMERAWLTLLGALGGLGAGLAGIWWTDGLARPELLATVFAMAFFFVFLMLARRDGYARAALSAAVVAVPLSLLFLWASLRYEAPIDYIETVHPVMIAMALAALPVPFLLAARREDGNWRHYPTLFAASWALALRSLAALLFVGIVWAVLLICNELLQLVGVQFLGTMLGRPVFGWFLSGAAFGLGHSVLGEVAMFGVPKLVLRLLRLFVPLALGIGLIFLLALPFRGLSELFGGRSPAATLMSIALGAIALVSVAVGEDDGDAVAGRNMRLMTRGLALILPVIAALAAWAVWLRVREYGWTPGRVLAGIGTGIVVAYAASYGLSAVRGGDWMGRIRRANVWVALCLIGLGALLFTPLLDTGAISARSQAARYLERTAPVADLPIWEMEHEWGRAGPAALQRMLAAEDHPEIAALRADIEWAKTAEDRWAGRIEPDRRKQNANFSAVVALAPVYPDGATLPGWFDSEMAGYRSIAWLAACEELLPRGRPGCAFIVVDLATETPEPEVMMIFANSPNLVITDTFVSPATQEISVQAFPLTQNFGVSSYAIFNSLADGDFGDEPLRLRSLRVGSDLLEPKFH
ncbi:MAG: hypothetical protein R3E44_13025 [Paracoccaceae bacterium]